MIAIVTNHLGPKIHARHGPHVLTSDYNTALSAEQNALKASRALATKMGWGHNIAIGVLDEGVYICIHANRVEER